MTEAIRTCEQCNKHLPPGTDHYRLSDGVYCTDCVDAHPYTSYAFYVGGDYMGDSDDDSGSRLVEGYEDEYEEEAEADGSI